MGRLPFCYGEAIKFTLPYASTIHLYDYDWKVAQVEVTIKSERPFTHVLFTQHYYTGGRAVMNAIEHLATSLYYGFLKGKDPAKISWTIYFTPQEFQRVGSYFSVGLVWDGIRFHWNKKDACPLSGFERDKVDHPKPNLIQRIFKLKPRPNARLLKRLDAYHKIHPLIDSPTGSPNYRDVWKTIEESDEKAGKKHEHEKEGYMYEKT